MTSDKSAEQGERIPFWDEDDVYLDEDGEKPLYIAPSSQTCHDCEAGPGELHLDGCDREQCPECGRQLISCPHADKYLDNPLP